MKKAIPVVLGVIVLLSIYLFFRISKNYEPQLTTTESISESSTSEESSARQVEVRAVWISYLELSMKNKNCTEEAFRAMADTMLRNISDAGMNTVFLHIRPCSDAFYTSEIFPYSEYLTGTEGNNPGFDPLKIFCDYAKTYHISIHAWINPFRVCSKSNWDSRSETNPAKQFADDSDALLITQNGIYYNPASKEVLSLLTRGVSELLEEYTIDGIHIDDYFYPSTDSGIDKKSYDEYLESGGTEPLDTWRRNNVNIIVSEMYKTVKSFGNDKIFSISPGVNIDYNYNNLYADVTLWASKDGYCDWLVPQLYVGFEHEKSPFSASVNRWKDIHTTENVRLIFGLSPYKCGEIDSNAGSGEKEWQNHSDILMRELKEIRQYPDYAGFSLYSYSYAFGENMNDISESEIRNLISVLK